MLLPKLFRTTGFRLTLLVATIFSLSALVLFGVIYETTASFLTRQLDRTVANELDEVVTETKGTGIAALSQAVADDSTHAPKGLYYLLSDPVGRPLAGNLDLPNPSVLLAHSATEVIVLEKQGPVPGIRGRTVRTGDGGILFVGIDDRDLAEQKEMVAYAFLGCYGSTVLLSLVAGAFLSRRLVDRVERVSHASRDIVAGDLERRIPVRGTDDEFDHLAVSLNDMLDRIQHLMEGMRQVSNDIAHDLKTPLTRLRHRLERMHKGVEEASPSPLATEAAIADIDAILDTFGALLRISQIESGSRKAGFVRLDLSELLENIGEIYQPVIEEREQSLAFNVPHFLFILGDRELLTQQFVNLLENAARHSPNGARIGIAATRADQTIEVSIYDNGPGIPEAYRQRVFDRLFRLEASRTTPGSGLGLALVAAIADLHGATVSLSNNQPGTRATIRFAAAAQSDGSCR